MSTVGTLVDTDLPLEAKKARPPDPRSFSRIALTALLVATAYYAGSKLGFVLRLPPTVPSVLWPPNAILTATLLVARPRHWPIYLLATLPAHLLVQLPMEWPLAMILGLFVTNCSEGLIAAWGMRRFSDDPTRVDTLWRAAAFIAVVGFAGPILSSFADAATVTVFRGQPYWLVWRTRCLSNILTELTVVPAILALLRFPAAFRAAPLRRRVEGLALGIAFLVVGSLGLTSANTGGSAWYSGTSPVFLLPFLLWGTVRFGPGGASILLLGAALFSIWRGAHGLGPFTLLPPKEAVVALQTILITLCVPLMCLAAVIEERWRTGRALEERLHFETLLSGLSGAFVHLPSDQMDRVIGTWLERVGSSLALVRLTLVEFVEPQGEPRELYSWNGAELASLPPLIMDGEFSLAVERIRREEPYAYTRIDELATATQSPPRYAARSTLILPLEAGGQVFGSVAFVRLGGDPTWGEPVVQRLRLIAAVFGNAIARKRSEDALRASEVMKSAILASLPSHVAVLDREGRILAVNHSGASHATDILGFATGASVGMSYLNLCGRAARKGMAPAAEAVSGIREVLEGSRRLFALEYASPASPPSDRWFAMVVVPLTGGEGGAVVSHTEVTERKRAELEAERSRRDLAHFTRVSTIGELTASLAHELNQPLTGILTNAQAARRFLNVERPDLREIREIIEDIIADDRRAGEVIERLRDLLRKGKPEETLIDLNMLVRDVVRLLGSDAVIRNVVLTTQLERHPVIVRGDRVQLQQAVLNLVVNALEAIGDGLDRQVVVQTRATEVDTAHVSVEDTGTGLPPGDDSLLFEPFYTTKASGMGMGLSITRSIVQSHGGVIWATNNPGLGATFHFALPLSRGEPS